MKMNPRAGFGAAGMHSLPILHGPVPYWKDEEGLSWRGRDEPVHVHRSVVVGLDVPSAAS